MVKPATDEQIAKWGAGDYDAPHVDVMVQALLARVEQEKAANKAFMETWKLAISDYDNQKAKLAKAEGALDLADRVIGTPALHAFHEEAPVVLWKKALAAIREGGDDD